MSLEGRITWLKSTVQCNTLLCTGVIDKSLHTLSGFSWLRLGLGRKLGSKLIDTWQHEIVGFFKSWWHESVDVNPHDDVGSDGKWPILSVPQAFGVYQACIVVSQGAWFVLFSSTCNRIWANGRQCRSQWNHTSRGNNVYQPDYLV